MRLLGNVQQTKNGKVSIDRAAWSEFEDGAGFQFDEAPAAESVMGRGAQAMDAQSMVDSLKQDGQEGEEGFDPAAAEEVDRMVTEARERLQSLESEVEHARAELTRINEEIDMLKQSREDLSNSLHEETEILLQRAKDEAEVKAGEFLKEAEENRDKLLSEARDEASKLRKDTFAEAYAKGEAQGHEDGFRAGFETGRKQGAREVESLIHSMAAALDKSNSLLADLAKDSEGQIISLALAIAKKVVQREIMLDPKATADLIRAALKKVSHRKDFFVKVSPVDMETLKAQEGYIRQDLLQAQTFQIVSDTRVEPGSCLIETEAGTVEASISQQLAYIEEQLQNIASAQA